FQQRRHPFRDVDILLAVSAYENEAVGCDAEAVENGRAFDLVPKKGQYLCEMRAYFEDAVGGETLGQQVAPGVLREEHIDCAEVIDDLGVELLGHPLVEAPVPRLHVEDRDLAAFRRNDRKARVRVAINQHGVRLLRRQDLVNAYDDSPDALSHGLARG